MTYISSPPSPTSSTVEFNRVNSLRSEPSFFHLSLHLKGADRVSEWQKMCQSSCGNRKHGSLLYHDYKWTREMSAVCITRTPKPVGRREEPFYEMAEASCFFIFTFLNPSCTLTHAFFSSIIKLISNSFGFSRRIRLPCKVIILKLAPVVHKGNWGLKLCCCFCQIG